MAYFTYIRRANSNSSCAREGYRYATGRLRVPLPPPPIPLVSPENGLEAPNVHPRSVTEKDLHHRPRTLTQEKKYFLQNTKLQSALDIFTMDFFGLGSQVFHGFVLIRKALKAVSHWQVRNSISSIDYCINSLLMLLVLSSWDFQMESGIRERHCTTWRCKRTVVVAIYYSARS